MDPVQIVGGVERPGPIGSVARSRLEAFGRFETAPSRLACLPGVGGLLVVDLIKP